MDQYVSDTMKELFVDVAGNPQMSAERAADSSWSDLRRDATTSTDYSRESFEESAERMGKSWEDTANDTVESRRDPWGTNIADVKRALDGGGG